MIARLFASALLVAGLSQAALAQNSMQQNQPSAPTQSMQSPQNMQSEQTVPQSLRQRLSSAGFTDVNIIPRSVLITAKDRNGRPVMMRITPNSMFFLTEIPEVSSSTTGAGRQNSNESGQGTGQGR